MKTINYIFQLFIRKSRVNLLITLMTLSIALVFSFNSIAVDVTGTFFASRCNHFAIEVVYEMNRAAVKKEPNNSRAQYNFGLVSFCLGYKEGAIDAFRASSNLNNPFASLAMARYYLTEGTWEISTQTDDLNNLTSSFYFYELAKMQIAEYGDAYPPEDFKHLEKRNRTSVMATALPSQILFLIYVHFVKNTEKEQSDINRVDTVLNVFKDQPSANDNIQLSPELKRILSLDKASSPTIAILKSTQISAQSCVEKWQNLDFPPVWQEYYPNTLENVQTICKAYEALAKNAIPLEEQRLVAIKNCKEEKLSDCDQYNVIVKKLIERSRAIYGATQGISL